MIFTKKRTSIFTCEFPIWYCLITQGIPRVMEQLQVEDGAQQCSCFTKLCCAAAAVLRTISVREDPHFLDNSTSYHCYHYDFPKSHLPKSSQFGFPSLLHCIHIYIYHICILYICLTKKTTNMCTKPGVSITTKGTSRRFCQSGLNTVLLVPRHRFLFTVDIPMNQWYWYWKNMMEIPSGKLT